jgi:hypothetical protein
MRLSIHKEIVGWRVLKKPIIMVSCAVFLSVLVFTVQWLQGAVDDARMGGGLPIYPHENALSASFSSDMPHGLMSVRYIQYINDNLYDRFAVSYQELRTALWLAGELEAMGHPPQHIELQSFRAKDVTHTWPMPMMRLLWMINDSPFIDMGLRADRMSQNVILTVPGQSEEVIIVGAHYDSIFFPGASDNASGMALLLESALRMRDADNYYTIKYIFFGAEEMGLLGVAHYVTSLTHPEHANIKFVINADVLFEGPYLFYMAGYDTNVRPGVSTADNWRRLARGLNFMVGGISPGANHITRTWDNVARDVSARHNITLEPWPPGVFGPSDHTAFLPFGHTVMFMSGLDKTNQWRNRTREPVNYLELVPMFMGMMRVVHSPRDDFHHINQQWPGKMEANMRGFSIFLEELLLADYGG